MSLVKKFENGVAVRELCVTTERLERLFWWLRLEYIKIKGSDIIYTIDNLLELCILKPNALWYVNYDHETDKNNQRYSILNEVTLIPMYKYNQISKLDEYQDDLKYIDNWIDIEQLKSGLV